MYLFKKKLSLIYSVPGKLYLLVMSLSSQLFQTDGGNRIKHTNNQRTSLFPSSFSSVTRHFDSAIAFVCYRLPFEENRDRKDQTETS